MTFSAAELTFLIHNKVVVLGSHLTESVGETDWMTVCLPSISPPRSWAPTQDMPDPTEPVQ